MSKHDGTKITGRIKKGETTTMKEGKAEGRRSRHKKSEGNKFIQPFLPPSVVCFDAVSFGRNEAGGRTDE